jgi:hypothetical protein
MHVKRPDSVWVHIIGPAVNNGFLRSGHATKNTCESRRSLRPHLTGTRPTVYKLLIGQRIDFATRLVHVYRAARLAIRHHLGQQPIGKTA